MAQQGTYLCDNVGDSADRFGLGSGDLCIPYERNDGTWGYVFGDAFVGQGASGTYLGSPLLLYQDVFDRSGETAIEFTGSQPEPRCAQLFDYQHQADNGFGYEATRIPNDAIALKIGGRERIFIQYTSVNQWVKQGSRNDGSLMAGIAYSEDNGVTWRDFDKHWPGDAQGSNGSLEMMWSFAGVDPDGLLYVFGKAWNGSHFYAGDAGLMQLVRYDPAVFFDGGLEQREHWVYLDGTWQWVPADVAAPSSIFGPGNHLGEFSVKRIENTYVMSYFDVSDYSVRTRTAPRPDAIWSNPKTQVSGSRFTTHAASVLRKIRPPSRWLNPHLEYLYGGYIHPGSESTSNLTLILSTWNGVLGHRPYTSTQWTGLSA